MIGYSWTLYLKCNHIPWELVSFMRETFLLYVDPNLSYPFQCCAAIDGFSLELIVIVLLDFVKLALVVKPMGGNLFPLIWVS